jgi:hypothetical protein
MASSTKRDTCEAHAVGVRFFYFHINPRNTRCKSPSHPSKAHAVGERFFFQHWRMDVWMDARACCKSAMPVPVPTARTGGPVRASPPCFPASRALHAYCAAPLHAWCPSICSGRLRQVAHVTICTTPLIYF